MAQLLADAVFSSSIYALLGVAFQVVFSANRRFDLFLAACIPIGAYSSLMAVPVFGFVGGLVCGVIASFAAGWAGQRIVYQRLDSRPRAELLGLVASLGLFTLSENLIAIVFGNVRRSIRFWPARPGLDFLGGRLTPVQLTIISAALCWLLALWLFLRYNRAGLRLRALSSDADLAPAVGIDVARARLWAMSVGACLAGSAGILLACDLDITPTMGTDAFLKGAVAALIGGRTVWGTAGGALLLGLAQHASGAWISTTWQDASAFLLLLLFLLLRPQGFRFVPELAGR